MAGDAFFGSHSVAKKKHARHPAQLAQMDDVHMDLRKYVEFHLNIVFAGELE